jgi:cation transport regulator
MPYDSIKDLPSKVKSLPTSAKKIFVSAFNSSFKSAGEEGAFKIAWSAVKSKYKKVGDSWIVKKTVPVKQVKVKGGLFGMNYYLDLPISSTDVDADGERVDKNLLQYAHERNIIDQEGDIMHLSTGESDTRYRGLFKLAKHFYKDGVLVGRVVLDRKHPKAQEYLDKYDNKMVGISAEFFEPEMQDNTIKHAKRIGWTIHSNPKNPIAG